MIIHIRKPRNPTRKHLELIKKKLFSKGLVYKINMQKTVVRGQEGSYVKPLWKPTGRSEWYPGDIFGARGKDSSLWASWDLWNYLEKVRLPSLNTSSTWKSQIPVNKWLLTLFEKVFHNPKGPHSLMREVPGVYKEFGFSGGMAYVVFFKGYIVKPSLSL